MSSASVIVITRFTTNLCLHPCRFYSTNKWPAIYLTNSSTKAELFLMGVDHVTSKSAEIVRNVELSEGRAEQLMAGQEPEIVGLWNILAMKGSLGQRLITHVLHNMNADLACTGLKPVEETRAAMKKGKDVGAKIAFTDEDFEVIVQRAAEQFSLIELYRYWKDRKELSAQYPNFFGALTFKDINHCAEAMLKLEALNEVQAILHDRNEHMVKNLREMKAQSNLDLFDRVVTEQSFIVTSCLLYIDGVFLAWLSRPIAMWRVGAGKFQSVALFNARFTTNLCLHPCLFYSTNKWPAIYLTNSSTKAELFLMGVDHVTSKSAEIVRNVELSEGRAEQLMAGQEPEIVGLWNILAMKGSLGQRLITHVLHNMNADLACTGLKPVEETRAAMKKGKDVGAKIAFTDEDFENGSNGPLY
ncbi:hypothetical protein L7F22_026851 [Adiantum nelumboides]|nr:hypothetical protein [Adiantum nelumboides]